MSFVDESGNPKWFSASLASNKTILDLAKAARDASTLLSANLKFVKTGAETAKKLLLLKANAISLVLNAIAGELESLYDDLSNAGFYAISINGQEEFHKKNKPLMITVKREFIAKMESNARTLDTLNGNKKMSRAYAKWIKEKTKHIGGGEYSSDKLPEKFQVEIDTDSHVSDYVKLGTLGNGVPSNALKQQTPSQFLGKLMQKFEDDADPNTPTFSSSGQMGAIIMMIGVPDVSMLSTFNSVISSLGSFVGDVVTGSVKVLGESVNTILTGPFVEKEYVMTLYGVYGYKVHPDGKEETFGQQFKKGDFIKGEDSTWTMEVIKVESDEIHTNLGTKPSTFKFKTMKDVFVDTTGGVVTPIEDTVLEGTPFDYVVDQTLVIKQTGLGNPAEGFGQMYPGERVRLAYKTTRLVQDRDNNGSIFTYDVTDFQFVNPRVLKQDPKPSEGYESETLYPITFAYKNVPADPPVIDPPAWGRYTLVDTFPAYGEFLKNILVFSNFLRSFATGVGEEIDKIIKFIDDIIKVAEDIVKSIQALLAFFDALKDAGVYGLIIQDPSGSGLLKGGTSAMVSAISNSTGDESFPEMDNQGNMIITGEQGKRVKPPDSLRYTAGFCLVFGGPGAPEAFETIGAVISPP